MTKHLSRKEFNRNLDVYYIKLMRDYEKQGIDWRTTPDQRQIQHSLNRSVHTTEVKIETQDGKK